MMRSFENRPDTIVCDEPLYAHYLNETGLEHPDRAEIIAHHETQPATLIDWLAHQQLQSADDLPQQHQPTIFYQKHMAHHLLPTVDGKWVERLTNCFLIRQPREMLTSLLNVIPQPTLSDTGLPQQLELFNRIVTCDGSQPPVLDSRDVLENPEAMLRALCAHIDIPFTDRMLRWAPGRRESDGIWAEHWYASVERSTGFQPYRPKDDEVPPSFQSLLDDCNAIYEELATHRLMIARA